MRAQHVAPNSIESVAHNGRARIANCRRWATRWSAVLSGLMALNTPAAPQHAAPAADPNKVVPVVMFVSWRDPSEGSFTLSVPKGWTAIGGTTRHSPLDIQQWARVAMPTGRIQIFVGDSDIVPRAVPNQLLASVGLREGQFERPSWGGSILIERFKTGAEFARDYAAKRLCRQAEITSSGDLPDQSRSMEAQVAPYARASNASIRASAGEAYYRCGKTVGYVTSTTILASPAAGPGAESWFVLQISGFVLTNAPDAGYAEYVHHVMASSVKVDPQWQARVDQQTRATTAAVTQMQQAMMDNLQRQNAELARTEQARAVASNNSFDVMGPWEKRMAALDNNRQKDSDTRLGITVTSDPLWGDRTVSNDSYAYWTRADGSIVGTSGSPPPGTGWRQMTTHP
jgi:hypothetical protein